MSAIMIAEDQAVVRQALVALLELEPDIHVVAVAAGHQTIAEVAARVKAQEKGWS
jgi:DNA-binding NarL/FixJ family response regulator